MDDGQAVEHVAELAEITDWVLGQSRLLRQLIDAVTSSDPAPEWDHNSLFDDPQGEDDEA